MEPNKEYHNIAVMKSEIAAKVQSKKEYINECMRNLPEDCRIPYSCEWDADAITTFPITNKPKLYNLRIQDIGEETIPTVDLAICDSVLRYLDVSEVKEVLSSLMSWLKPEGYALIMDFVNLEKTLEEEGIKIYEQGNTCNIESDHPSTDPIYDVIANTFSEILRAGLSEQFSNTPINVKRLPLLNEGRYYILKK